MFLLGSLRYLRITTELEKLGDGRSFCQFVNEIVPNFAENLDVRKLMASDSRQLKNPEWQEEKEEGQYHNEAADVQMKSLKDYFKGNERWTTTTSLISQATVERNITSKQEPMLIPLVNDKYVLSSRPIFQLNPSGKRSYFDNPFLLDHAQKYAELLRIEKLMEERDDYAQMVVEATEVPIEYAVADAFNSEKLYCGNRCKRNTWCCNGVCCDCGIAWEFYRARWRRCPVCTCITPSPKFMREENRCKDCYATE